MWPKPNTAFPYYPLMLLGFLRFYFGWWNCKLATMPVRAKVNLQRLIYLRLIGVRQDLTICRMPQSSLCVTVDCVCDSVKPGEDNGQVLLLPAAPWPCWLLLCDECVYFANSLTGLTWDGSDSVDNNVKLVWGGVVNENCFACSLITQHSSIFILASYEEAKLHTLIG